MTYIAVSEDAPIFRGGVAQMLESKEFETILTGPYECVGGETLIYDPVTGTETPIAKLARIGRPIHVLTANGVREASAPFKKGIANLFEVKTDDGQSFVATAHHRVLTLSGWTSVCEISVGTSLPSLPASSLARDQQGFRQGDGYSIQTLRDYRDGYFSCRHQGDEQPLGVQGNAQAFVPLRVDAHERSCDDLHLGDRVSLSEHSRPDLLCAPPSIDHLRHQYGAASRRGYCVSLRKYGSSHLSIRPSCPFGLESNLQRSIGEGLECQQLLQAYSCPLCAIYGIQTYSHYTAHLSTVSRVISVNYIRTDEYYDLHVPGDEHYYAQGFFHHNTGKTYASLYKLHLLLCLFPRSRALMARKTYKSLVNSAIVTYETKILPVSPDSQESPIKKFGGIKPELYRYPNGSLLIPGGVDNPDKVLSAEYDFIYVNQAEELVLDEWEKLAGRATGRAGNAPYTLIFGDCNPGAPTHWIKQRSELNLIETRHEDNPRLYDAAKKEWTARGQRSLKILDSLTGLRYKRGRLGLWVAAEGQVYEFDPVVHLVNYFDPPKEWRRIRAIDFGLKNPFTCLWLAIDPDERLYLYREIYMTGRTVRAHAVKINELSAGERIEATVADHDAEDRATMAENGIKTIAADKRIKVGIEKVEDRLKIAKDGKPRLFLMRDVLVEVDEELRALYKPVNTEQEFASYVYPMEVNGKPNKETPVDLDNHGLDALRYGVMYLDGKKKRREAGSYQG